MAYIFCDACGVGFHSNVHSCPQCGRHGRRVYTTGRHVRRPMKPSHARPALLREDVEGEVLESIYGWRSGTVALCDRGASSEAVSGS